MIKISVSCFLYKSLVSFNLVQTTLIFFLQKLFTFFFLSTSSQTRDSGKKKKKKKKEEVWKRSKRFSNQSNSMNETFVYIVEDTREDPCRDN